MGIYTTLYNGLSGINIFGDNMSVLADNIANLNTTAFKTSRSNFEEIIADASTQYNSGAGAQLNSISANFSLGGLVTTNVPSDVAINGKGFFVVQKDAVSPDLYTRDGQFSLQESSDSQDVLNLLTAMGYYVQGYDIGPVTGTTATTLSDITVNRISDPQPTENLQAVFNLQATNPAPIGTPALFESWDGRLLDANGLPDPISSTAFEFSSNLNIFDDQGDSHDLTIYFDNTPNVNEKAFLLTCDPTEDRRLIGAGPARYNDSGTVVNKGAGALLYGLLQFDEQGNLLDLSCYQVPADGNVDPDRATNLLQLGRGESDYAFTYNFTGQGNDLSSTINFGTTALAQSITSPDALLVSRPGELPQPASSTTTWSEVYDVYGNSPAAGDVIIFTGTDGTGNPVNYSFTIDPDNQIADLLANLQDQFGCTAILNDGKLQLTDNVVGDSQLAINSILFQDASGATPAASTSLAQVFGNEGDGFVNREQTMFQLDPLTTTNYANSSVLLGFNRDGYGTGYLESIAVDKYGVITGIYSNGHQVAEAQLALSDFNDYTGLRRIGANTYAATDAVGPIKTGVAGSSGLGTVTGGALEGSNVDLGDQFTQLITTQRYYQANSKSISTADEVYQTLVRMIT